MKAHFHRSGAVRHYHENNKSERRCVRVRRRESASGRRDSTFRSVSRASCANRDLVMTRWWMVVLLASAAAAGGRLPRTSPPAPAPAPAPSALPRLPQRNLTLASRSSVRNRSVPTLISLIFHKTRSDFMKVVNQGNVTILK